jgi:hypothetical protein
MARSQNVSCLTTISCPPARIANMATELTRKDTPVITIAPRAALILVDPSFRQIVHVAADAPASRANDTADVSTSASSQEASVYPG